MLDPMSLELAAFFSLFKSWALMLPLLQKRISLLVSVLRAAVFPFSIS